MRRARSAGVKGVSAAVVALAAVLGPGVVGLGGAALGQVCPGQPTFTSGGGAPCSSPVVLTWSVPPLDTASEWEVYRSTDGTLGALWTVVTTRSVSVARNPAGGLDQTITIRGRRAANPFGCPTGLGPFSAPLTVAAIPAAPGAVVGLSAQPGCGRVTASWSEPGTGTGGGGATAQYRVRVLDASGTELENTTTTATEFEVLTSAAVGLAVTALGPCGAAGPETTIPAVAPTSVPTGPITGLASAYTCVDATARWVFTWDPVPGAESYTVSVQAGVQVLGSSGVTQPRFEMPPQSPSPFGPSDVMTIRITPSGPCGAGNPWLSALDESTLSATGVPGPITVAPATGGGSLVTWGAAPGAVGYRYLRTTGTNPFSTTNLLSIDVMGATAVYEPMTTRPLNIRVIPIDACGTALLFNGRFVSVGGGVPAFTVQAGPESVERSIGQSATLRVFATPTGLTYRWRRQGGGVGGGGVDLTDGGLGGRVSGATTAQLTITDLRPEHAGVYEAIVSGPAGQTPVTVTAGVVVTNPCSADFDASGLANIDDIFIFLNAWFAGCP